MKKNNNPFCGSSLKPKPVLLLTFLSFMALWQTAEAVSAPAMDLIYLDQGWDAKTRELYYYTPQGSRLIPYAWFNALEQPGNNQAFAAPDNLAKYGWISDLTISSELNPDSLPIGFAIDPVDVPGSGKWLGLTCSACHTNNISVKGQTFRIDGAPAAIELDVFFTDLAKAVQATRFDKTKFQRFTAKVLGKNPDVDAAKKLEDEYAKFAVSLAGQMWMRTPPIPAGPGRVDALGQIINALSVFDLQEPDNLRAPSAPVNYPFLWITPRLHWVQWDPIASNPLARNAGEVLGVFGHANFSGSEDEVLRTPVASKVRDNYQHTAQEPIPTDWQHKILVSAKDKPANDQAERDKSIGDNKDLLTSTVLYKNIYALEQWLTDLKEPTWQEPIFGSINVDLAKQGAALFHRDCLSCHNMPPYALTPKEDNIVGKQFIKIGRVNYKTVGTDKTYIENILLRNTKTGKLGPVLFGNQNVVASGGFFLGSVAAVVQKGLNDLGLSPKEKLAYSDYRLYPPKAGEQPQPYKPPAIDDLKAGPLLGIWATGPFLHNGSVPNIDELLSAPESRSKKFWVGSHELDTEKLGFVSSEQPGLFLFDTGLKGNGNQGHAYPAKLYTKAERQAVIEYLKDPLRVTKAVQK